MELTWIERGLGLRFVGDSAAPFAADDLVLLGSHVPHNWVSSGDHGTGVVTATVLQFAPELLTEARLPEFSLGSPLAEKANTGLLIESPCRDQVIQTLTRMRTGTALGRLAGFCEILGFLLHHEDSLARISTSYKYSASDTPDGRLAQRRIDRVIDWIHRRLSHELTISAGARIAAISPRAFSRFFRREVGKTFTQYVNDVRCGEARLYLQRSDLAVQRIAQECGFSTLSHFNRQFRLRTGVSPRQFRRSVRV